MPTSQKPLAYAHVKVGSGVGGVQSLGGLGDCKNEHLMKLLVCSDIFKVGIKNQVVHSDALKFNSNKSK